MCFCFPSLGVMWSMAIMPSTGSRGSAEDARISTNVLESLSVLPQVMIAGKPLCDLEHKCIIPASTKYNYVVFYKC